MRAASCSARRTDRLLRNATLSIVLGTILGLPTALAAAERIRVIAPAAEEEKAAEEKEDPPRSRRAFSFAIPLIVVGAGVALWGVGALSTWRLDLTQEAFDTAPNESVEDLRELDRLSRRGRFWATFANATLVGGAAALAAGGVLFVVSSIRARHKTSAGRPPPVEAVPGGVRIRF